MKLMGKIICIEKLFLVEEKIMEKREQYVKPMLEFGETDIFEDVTPECWSKPYLYRFVDPTDEDECGWTKKDSNYGDLSGMRDEKLGNGCNPTQQNAIVNWMVNKYGSGEGHHFTKEDVETIMKSAGGSNGQNFNGQTDYVIKERSV